MTRNPLALSEYIPPKLFGSCVILLAALCMCGGGCATMTVKVAIFDQKYYPYSAELVEACKNAAADVERMNRRDAYNEWRASLKVRVFEVIEKSPELVNQLDSAAVDELINRAEAIIEAQIAAAREKHFAAVDTWDKARTAQDDKTFQQLVRKAFSDFAEGNRILRDVPTLVRNELNKDPSVTGGRSGAARAPEAALAHAVANRIVAVAGTTARGLIADNGIQGDRIAASIINAPEAAWKGDINHTAAFGGLGNTDIAVKMESLGEFTVKGVRVDAAKVTRATFIVVKQAIQLIAAANGIVVPTAAAGNQQPANEVVVPDATLVGQVSSADHDTAVARAKVRGTKLATISIFDAVVSQRTSLAGTDADRKKAIQSIKSLYGSIKGQLNPPTDSTATGAGDKSTAGG
jgi:hypothetical protein